MSKTKGIPTPDQTTDYSNEDDTDEGQYVGTQEPVALVSQADVERTPRPYGSVDTSLDEGEKLHDWGCIRPGASSSHFVFRARNEARTRHDIHVTFDPKEARTFWDALMCSCPTGRHAGDPCWHKGAVRAWLADNAGTRYANRLLGLPLR